MCSILFMFVGLILVVSSSPRSIHDHIDTGNCSGEIRRGNSEWTPYHYSIYLELKPQLKVFKGEVNISGSMNSSFSNTIDLHSVNLYVRRVAVDGTELKNYDWYLDNINGLLRIIRLPDRIVDATWSTPDGVVNTTLSISYEGKFNETSGIIKQIYNETDQNRWIIFSYLEPTSARTVFPCIDLPKYKATFDISISNPGPGRVVLSNMPQKSNDPNIITFQTTPPMSTYLVAFVVCDYVPVRSRRNITTWVPKEMKMKAETLWVTNLTSQFLQALENYTGNVYSLPKLDQFVVMDKPGIGGMENWGLIMYEINSFIPTDPSANTLLRVIYSVAHELSHHWFGNSVTTADWCGMWYQEAIPTFLEGLIPLQKCKETDMVDKVKWMARKEVMDAECFFNEQSSPLRDEEDPKSSYDDLFSLSRYFKGASVFYMIESWVNPNVFQSSLRSFIRKYNYSFTNENELWNEVKIHAGNFVSPSFDEVLNTWVTMKSHPVVFLERTENGKLSMGQRVCFSNYFLAGEWWIPITYTTSSRPDFNDTSLKHWIAPEDEHKKLDVTLKNDEWILINILGSGYYRVEYDHTTWKLLVDQLKRNHTAIPPINRAILVDDSFHTANSGEGLVKAFEIMEYLPQEENAFVWEGVLINIQWHYKEAPDTEKDLLKKYLQHLLESVFIRTILTTTESDWGENTSSRTENLYNRALMEPVFELSYMMELPACFKFSTAIAMKLMKGSMKKTTIPPELRRKLWCAAVARGSEDVFLYVKRAFGSEKDAKEKAKLFEQLQCSKNHTTTLLNLLLKNNVGGSKAALREAVKSFLVHHWPGQKDTCEKILDFFAKNKLKLVEHESELKMEFENYVTNPPARCKNLTEKIFSLNSANPAEDESELASWEQTYGTEPQKWLNNYLKKRRINQKNKN